MIKRFAVILAFLIFAANSGSAWADCNIAPSGTRPEGAIVYNRDHNVLQYCAGTEWKVIVWNAGGGCTTPSAGLIGHWKLDETSGTAAGDFAGTNSGTLASFPADPWMEASGVLDGALDFDGADDVVNMPAFAGFDNMAAFTVTGWIRPDTPGEVNNGMIFHKNTAGSSGSPTNGWLLRFGSDNSITFIVDYATTDLEHRVGANFIPMNAWTHIAVTWTGSATATDAKIYLNGAEAAYYQTTTNGAGARQADSGAILRLGNSTSNSRTFDGLMDNVRVYDRALTSLEIGALNSEGIGACSSGGSSTPDCTDDDTATCTLDADRDSGDPEFTAANIASGVNILGVTGTLSAGGCAGPADCPNVGNVCTNGYVFAGCGGADLHPFLVTRCDAGQTWGGSSCGGTRVTRAWNNANTSGYVTTNLLNASDGQANTAALQVGGAQQDSNSGVGGVQPHQAADYCATLSLHNKTDWYLPARAEFYTMWLHSPAIGNFDTGGGNYWSSSEDDNDEAMYQDSDNGGQKNDTKDGALYVRCARHD